MMVIVYKIGSFFGINIKSLVIQILCGGVSYVCLTFVFIKIFRDDILKMVKKVK